MSITDMPIIDWLWITIFLGYANENTKTKYMSLQYDGSFYIYKHLFYKFYWIVTKDSITWRQRKNIYGINRSW